MDSRLTDLFFELHSDAPLGAELEREAPGDPESSARALAILRPFLPERPRVADLGCGPGPQTRFLVERGLGDGALGVLAVDRHLPYLARIRRWASGSHAPGRPVAADLGALPLRSGALDLVWSEGAVYAVGFERGLEAWRRFLASGGCVAVTEVSWLVEAAPEEAAAFWRAAYPEMGSVEQNRARARAAGYRVIDDFTLPAEAWWSGYYGPLERRIAVLEERHRDDSEALEMLAGERREIELYRDHGTSYGYVFYCLRRT